MMQSKKTFYLVIYDVKKPKGANMALKSIISEASAKIIFNDSIGKPTITRKECGSKYLLVDKRYFSFINADGNEVLFIICDGEKQL